MPSIKEHILGLTHKVDARVEKVLLRDMNSDEAKRQYPDYEVERQYRDDEKRHHLKKDDNDDDNDQ